MITRVILFLVAVMFTVPAAYAQSEGYTSETDAEVLRLIRKDKLDLILPGAMRDNNVDMWIHVTRGQGINANSSSGDKMTPQFGNTSGYLIFTDLGDRIERAMFGMSSGAVDKIDVRGSREVNMALGGYNYNNLDKLQTFTIPEVYDEITQFVAERDPKTIAVNYSEWLPLADGISYTSYVKLQKIIGPKYSERMVSAENVILDFVLRRTTREIGAQAHVLAMSRQESLRKLRSIVPGKTSRGEAGVNVLYSAVSDRSVTRSGNYTLQRGDFFYDNHWYDYLGYDVDTKNYGYILRGGETQVPDFIQDAFETAIAGQWIMRPHMRVGMTAGKSMEAMIKAMEDAGYVYTPFTDNGARDYQNVQRVLATTDKPSFSIDNHALGNNGAEGPSMGPFRTDSYHLKIQENHFFAFEYMINVNIDERPGFPLAFNISNLQIITSRGVENLQPPNEEIIVIH